MGNIPQSSEKFLSSRQSPRILRNFAENQSLKKSCDSKHDSINISCPLGILSKVAINQRRKKSIIISGNCTRMPGSSENTSKLRARVFVSQSFAISGEGEAVLYKSAKKMLPIPTCRFRIPEILNQLVTNNLIYSSKCQ